MATRPFFEILDLLDTIIEAGPDSFNFASDIAPLLALPAARTYFYTKLSDPKWIPELAANGELNYPARKSARNKNPEQWPQSGYLTRMADIEPNLVQETLQNIEPGNNYFVQSDLIEILSKLPVNFSHRNISRVNEWISTTPITWNPEKYGQFIVHLAVNGHLDDAIHVTESLLKLHAPKRSNRHADKPESRFESWRLKRALEQILQSLIDVDGMKVLRFLVDQIMTAEELAATDKSKSANKRYNQSIWPRAIEEHEQNQFADDALDHIVFATRDIAENLISQHGKMVLDALESQQIPILLRISIYLRTKFLEVDLDGTSSIVASRWFLEEHWIHHERFHLLRTVFSRLSQDAQDAYFAFVVEPIDRNAVEGTFKFLSESKPTDEEVDKEYRRQQFRRLIPIKDQLLEEWKGRFEALRLEFDESDHPDFEYYVGKAEFVPTKTPGTLDELSARNDSDLIQYLHEFEVTDDRMDSSLGGLGMQLGQLVQQNPERYLRLAPRLKGVQPELIKGMLSAVTDMVRNKTELDPGLWASVLELCIWVTEQPREGQIRKGRYAKNDPNWMWTRKCVGDLLYQGFQRFDQENCGIPSECRDAAWLSLLPITNDENPTSEEDAAADSPFNLAINTVRGKAIEVVGLYALWVFRHAEKSGLGQITFADIPEARDVLERHLDPDVDSSRAIRSAYGRQFPWLYHIDKAWASEWKSKIFPREKEQDHLYRAAWETYVMFCAPYNNVFKGLQEEYAFAIEYIGTWDDGDTSVGHPDRSLIEHLIVFYWRGLIDVTEPDNLLARAYERASDDLRGHATHFIGRILLENSAEDLVETNAARFQELLEHRLAIASAAKNNNDFREEFKWFGLWFASGKLDEAWAIAQLQHALEIAEYVEHDSSVAEQLAKTATNYPLESVQCLTMMVDGAEEPWQVSAMGNHARGILEKAINSDNAEARNKAIELVNRLGARGFLEYRDLRPDQ